VAAESDLLIPEQAGIIRLPPVDSGGLMKYLQELATSILTDSASFTSPAFHIF
jgi:hypothetical protein